MARVQDTHSGRLLDFPGLLHYVFENKLPKSDYHIVVSLQNPGFEEEDTARVEAKTDEEGNFNEEFSLPSMEEYMTDPEKYGYHLSSDQRTKIKEKNVKFDERNKKNSKDSKAHQKDATETVQCKHWSEIKFGLVKDVCLLFYKATQGGSYSA